MKIIEKFEISEIEFFLKESNSFREFLLKIGSSSNGSGAYKSIKSQLESIGIEIPIFNYRNTNFSKKTNDCEIFIENSSFSRQHLKERVIKNKLIKYECVKCKNKGEWFGIKLSLQLEHINGVNNDNRLSNLCFLCPNCHSQTDTYSGKKNKIAKKSKSKNISLCSCGEKIYKGSEYCKKCDAINQRKVKDRPSLEQLLIDIKDKNYVLTGKKYGVSDNAIRKWIKKYENG